MSEEAQWYDIWKSEELGHLPAAEMAARGGALARTLSQVFIAGYQAALRFVFPEVPVCGWSAFAASEDRNDPVANPPLRLIGAEGTLHLEGTKSWIAQSAHVDHLVVTALNDIDEVCTVLVSCRQPGIEITHRANPSFLAGMSQGFARFKDVAIRPDDILGGERRKAFLINESKFIMTSITAWLWRHAEEHNSGLAGAFGALTKDLSQACDNGDLSARDWARLDDRLQSLYREFEAPAAMIRTAGFKNDERLISLYSPGLQKRAQRNG